MEKKMYDVSHESHYAIQGEEKQAVRVNVDICSKKNKITQVRQREAATCAQLTPRRQKLSSLCASVEISLIVKQ